ncbi:SHOCT domain-containing protein [Geodermatophilus sp. SYSU D00758]
MVAAADDCPLVDLMWTFVLFFALMIYLWLVITVFGDLFRRHDVSGWAKTGWVLVVLVLPLVGSLTYLVPQGRAMADRDVPQVHRVQRQDGAVDGSRAAPGVHRLDEIAGAKQLLDQGAINPQEFEQLKRRVLV